MADDRNAKNDIRKEGKWMVDDKKDNSDNGQKRKKRQMTERIRLIEGRRERIVDKKSTEVERRKA
jgi:hypothetical protein